LSFGSDFVDEAEGWLISAEYAKEERGQLLTFFFYAQKR
jgi:hypothetical protein